MRRPTALAVAVLLSLAAAPAAAAQDEPSGPRQETASAGTVAATLDYTMRSRFEARDVRLTITRGGVPALAGASLDRLCRGCAGAIPIAGISLEGGDTTSLILRDLTGDGDPEVIVDLYTGGAHCCTIMALFGWDAATSRYRRLVRNFADPSFAIKHLSGGPGAEIVTSDARFAYTFCAYACSAMPGQVFRYEGFRLVDVTREFPDRIRAGIRSIRGSLRKIRRAPRDQRIAIKGVLPALCADLYLLDRGDECRAELRRALRRGELSDQEVDLAPSGRAYIRQVLRFLQKTGYR